MESLRYCTLRGQLELIPSEAPVSIDDVEPASEIVKRFVTGGLDGKCDWTKFLKIIDPFSRSYELRINLHGSPHNSGQGYE